MGSEWVGVIKELHVYLIVSHWIMWHLITKCRFTSSTWQHLTHFRCNVHRIEFDTLQLMQGPHPLHDMTWWNMELDTIRVISQLKWVAYVMCYKICLVVGCHLNIGNEETPFQIFLRHGMSAISCFISSSLYSTLLYSTKQLCRITVDKCVLTHTHTYIRSRSCPSPW